MEKVLSISIAAYNMEKYILELLERLVKCRTLEKIELLVIDDGATDSTYQIACRYMKDYPHVVKAIHKENGGWGSTVNTGIQQATGKYFKLLDGDDYYDIDSLDKLVEYLELCDMDAILSPYTRFTDKSTKMEIPENPVFSISAPKEVRIEDLPITPFTLEMYSLTFRTHLLKDAKISISEHKFYTDNEYVAKSINCCNTLAVVPFNVYFYRVGRDGQSVSIEGMRKHYKEFESVLRSMLLFVRDEVTNQQLKNIFMERYRGLSYYYFEVLFALGNKKEYIEHCKYYDLWLKKEFPVIYSSIKYHPIRILRIMHYRLFGLARLFK